MNGLSTAMKKGGVSVSQAKDRLPRRTLSQCRPDVNSATACISRSLILDAI
jgi:hypothetical protein